MVDRMLIRRNHAVFERMVGRAAAAAGRGKRDKAIAWASVASAFATHHVTGLLVSPRLEGILDIIGAGLMQRPRARPAATRRVLHVLSRASEIGGHGRLVRSWIGADCDSRSSVVLTDQAACPHHLVAAATATGGTATALDGARPLIERAVALRHLAAQHDIVVLSQHAHDVIPLTALSFPARPPVILSNHADHSFWVGARVTDVVADLRPAGSALTAARRSIPASFSVQVPVPPGLERPEAADGHRARARLGIPADAVLLLTVADVHKYRDASPHMAALLGDVLATCPNVFAVAVGPGDDLPWQWQRQHFAPRLIVLSPTPGLDDLRAAADVYVDSYPIGSLTSLLDSAVLGTPVVSLQPLERAPALKVDLPIMEAAHVVHTPDALVAELTRLAGSAELRRQSGSRIRDLTCRDHSVALLRDAVERAYALAADLPARARPRQTTDPEPCEDALDLQLVAAYRAAGWVAPLDEVIETIYPTPRRSAATAVLGGVEVVQAIGRVLRPSAS